MRIVIGHTSFDGFGGTETYMLTIAKQLQTLGHDVTIYGATKLGPIAEQARSAGVSVVGALDQLPAECDATIANDNSSAVELAARYPAAARAMVVHSSYFELQSPPQTDGVCDLLIAMSDRIVKHIESLAFHPPVARLSQPVDTVRFGPLGGNPTKARTALVLGNYISGPAAAAITDACAAAGIEAIFAGSKSTFTGEPERAIADADLVIGLGRCIVEAMSGRRAAYVFGIAGGDGWVTAENYAAFESDGFAGGATGELVTFDRLTRELAEWSSEMGPANRQIAVANHDAADHARALVEQLSAIEPSGSGIPLEDAAERARLLRAEWETWGNWMRTIEENRQQSRHIEELLERLDSERIAYDALVESRRYRLATRLSAPIDWIRAKLRR
jgi:hypothetical protein